MTKSYTLILTTLFTALYFYNAMTIHILSIKMHYFYYQNMYDSIYKQIKRTTS